VASRLEREHDSEGDRFHARVKYTYVVDTIELKSSRVVFGDFLSSSEKTARKRVLQYPLGAEVQVFYDPRSPDESVLQPGCSTPLFAVGILGVIFLLVGSFAVLRPLAG
jgi:hypothetical protein